MSTDVFNEEASLLSNKPTTVVVTPSNPRPERPYSGGLRYTARWWEWYEAQRIYSR